MAPSIVANLADIPDIGCSSLRGSRHFRRFYVEGGAQAARLSQVISGTAH
jgi:hypothetical protein